MKESALPKTPIEKGGTRSFLVSQWHRNDEVLVTHIAACATEGGTGGMEQTIKVGTTIGLGLTSGGGEVALVTVGENADVAIVERYPNVSEAIRIAEAMFGITRRAWRLFDEDIR
jgi:hypothetical protein